MSLRDFLADPGRPKGRCFIGFDGFTDELLTPVMLRDGANFTPFPTIQSFGERVVEAAGKSVNIEMVPKTTKLGGNAAILANALLEGGHPIVFMGNIGVEGKIEPLFRGMAERCERVIPLGISGHTDALEFDDGKIMLGKMHDLLDIKWEKIIKTLPLKELIQILDSSRLWIFCNWTMITSMTEIWNRLLLDVIPRLSPRPRSIFVDIADPAKRSDEDLKRAVEMLGSLNKKIPVHLGLNASEAEKVAHVVGCDPHDLSSHAHLHRVIVHTAKYVFSGTTFVETIPIKKKLISTGAGDHFNAGYCNGLLSDFPLKERLELGVATASYYISHAKSPNTEELLKFIS